MKKLNLGSGTIFIPGWTSIDNSPSVILAKAPPLKFFKWVLYKLKMISRECYQVNWPKDILFWDIRLGLPYKANSIKIIYSSHLLEHLTKKQAEQLLKRCYRVLKPKGIIRLVVPDLDLIVKDYLSKSKQDQVFEATDFLLKKIFEGGKHRWMYNFQTLGWLLEKIGFKNIQKRQFSDSQIKEIKKIESKKTRHEMSLYVEAIKEN